MRLIFLTVIWSILCSHRISNEPSTFVVSGTIYSTSIHRGGIDIDDRNIPQIPMKDYTICLVQWKSADSLPVFVKKITTDADGKFRTKLPAGQYGFVTVDELDSLQAGQYLPKYTEEWKGANLYTRSWRIEQGGPIYLRNKDVTDLVIICHQSSYCMNCP